MVLLPTKKKNRNRPRRSNASSRLLESNGPDIKIKGSAPQIVEKYLALSRESQSSGDPIAAESYLQYAEHYQRIVDANELKIQRNQNQSADEQVISNGHDVNGQQKEKIITQNQSNSDNVERSKIIPVTIEEQSIGK
ncbi:MAG: DUF4167 domain-containing protein [Pseudomonadota bacterium]|jgi:hypothetical protein|nr:DUF4167 domain-containing protein [Pseudomonadota bacterium]MEC8426633.1 DUF4167 domain-containing protein [Pseudomonadota bacterium]MEC8447572.1 DUF4167 domain-containing protein [Pseudomonadota bacterium]MEC8496426.1 DUF4167 domain-containing protein [Pseudomonadota bacterium]MED5288244.1 DUF4167 domain-containing protein [Pseudomonadota bacterium]|tara:strand:- start:353 stop:763 length:411 start_codon:yes stop_codon:yes gene_type:complete